MKITVRDDLTDSKERLFEPGELVISEMELTPAARAVLAQMRSRVERMTQFYRAHPRAYQILVRIPAWRHRQ